MSDRKNEIESARKEEGKKKEKRGGGRVLKISAHRQRGGEGLFYLRGDSRNKKAHALDERR